MSTSKRAPQPNAPLPAGNSARPAPVIPGLDPGRRGDGAARSSNDQSSSLSRPSPRDAGPATSGNAAPAPPKLSPSAVAAATWAKIGAEFVANRSRSRHVAFKQLQLAVMQNCAILSPDYLSPKDIVGMSMDIEKFLKENPEETGAGRSALDIVSDFLQGDSPGTAIDSPTQQVM